MIQINSVQLNFGLREIRDVTIYFRSINDGADVNRTDRISYSGNMTIPFEDYQGSSGSFDALVTLVEDKIIESFGRNQSEPETGGQPPAEEQPQTGVQSQNEADLNEARATERVYTEQIQQTNQNMNQNRNTRRRNEQPQRVDSRTIER